MVEIDVKGWIFELLDFVTEEVRIRTNYSIL